MLSFKQYLTEIKGSKEAAAEPKKLLSFIKENKSLLNKKRLIINVKEKIDFKNVSMGKQEVGMKPAGLWYGIGSEWLDWIVYNMPQWIGNYIHEIEVNHSKMILINDNVELYDFIRRFKNKDSERQKSAALGTDPNWRQVTSLYSGIEVPSPRSIGGMDAMWLRFWDVGSGAVWKKDAIRKIKRLAKFENEEWELI